MGCLGRAEPERAQRIKASAVPRRAVCGAALFDVPGGIAELGQHELHAPELTLRAEAVLAEDLHLLVEALLLERAARLLEGLAICCCGRTAGPSQHASQAMRSSGSAAAVRRRSRGRGGAVAARFTLRGGGTHACTTTACLAASALGPAAACTPLGLVVSGLDAHAANKKKQHARIRALPPHRARARAARPCRERAANDARWDRYDCLSPPIFNPAARQGQPLVRAAGPASPALPTPLVRARRRLETPSKKKRKRGRKKRRRRGAAAAARPPPPHSRAPSAAPSPSHSPPLRALRTVAEVGNLHHGGRRVRVALAVAPPARKQSPRQRSRGGGGRPPTEAAEFPRGDERAHLCAFGTPQRRRRRAEMQPVVPALIARAAAGGSARARARGVAFKTKPKHRRKAHYGIDGRAALPHRGRNT